MLVSSRTARRRSLSKVHRLPSLLALAVMAATWIVCPVRAQPDDPTQPIGILLAAGDIAGCFQDKRKYKEVAVVIGDEIKKAGTLPIAVLVLGDLAYAKRNTKGKIIAPDYQQCFEEFTNTWGKYKEYLLPVPGNHDYADDPTQAGIFKAYFADTLKKFNADPNAHFYVTRFPQGHAASWLLVGLNFYKDLKRQKAWLSTQLSTPDPRCVLVFTHPFLNSSGHHGVKQTQGTMRLAAMAPFFKIAYDGGATVLVTAHDHDLEQFDRQDDMGKASPQGVRSFVVGTGALSCTRFLTRRRTH